MGARTGGVNRPVERRGKSMKRNLWLRQLMALMSKEFQQIARDPSSYLVAGCCR